MPRIRHSASVRPRVRLISTPGTTYPDTEGHSMTTTIAGVKFSDQLGALLDHAISHGFRIEADTRGKQKGPAVVAYAPDKEISPITISEVRSKLNPAHYDNIRRQLYRAGCPPLPGDERPTTEEETDMSKTTTARKTATATKGTEKPIVHLHNQKDLEAALANDETRADTLAGVIAGLFDRAGLGSYDGLAGGMVYTIAMWADEFRADLAMKAAELAYEETRSEIDQALKLAADAEAEAARLRTQLDRVTASEEAARRDCGAALERAKTAEAEATELRSALAPLRALLGKD
jgi:hypothetical protein